MPSWFYFLNTATEMQRHRVWISVFVCVHPCSSVVPFITATADARRYKRIYSRNTSFLMNNVGYTLCPCASVAILYTQQKKFRCFPEGIKRRKGRVLLRLVYSLKRYFKMRFYHNDTTDTTVVRLRCMNVVRVVPSWFDIFCLWDSMPFAPLRLCARS